MLNTLALSLLLTAAPQADTLAAVDLYGLRTLAPSAIRAAVGLGPGDPTPANTTAIAARLRALPGVADAEVSRVCCTDDGRTVLYVGIRETGTPALT